MNDSIIVFGVLLAIALTVLVFVLFRGTRRLSKRDIRFFRNEWEKIQAHADSKHALLDADKLLHLALRKKGFQGGVGEQLKKAGKLFTNLNDVWAAHKLRNRIAHELDVQLGSGDRNHALRSFEKALKDLGAL